MEQPSSALSQVLMHKQMHTSRKNHGMSEALKTFSSIKIYWGYAAHCRTRFKLYYYIVYTRENAPPSFTQMFFFDFTEFLWQYWHAGYIRPCFETNLSAVYLGAIVWLAGERSLQGRRINVEWLTSLCWRNEFSIHSQASRGETSFRKVNTIWRGPTKDEKARHGTVSKDSALLHSPVLLPPFPPRPQ